MSIEPSTVELYINSHRFHFENMLQLDSSKQCLYQFLSREYSQDPLEFLILEVEYRQSVIQYFRAADKLSQFDATNNAHPALTLSQEKEQYTPLESSVAKLTEQVETCAQTMQSTATQLFHLYISEKSSKQLNLDSHLRKQLLKRKELLNASLNMQDKPVLYQFFCKVVDAMTVQLCTDCFPRFLKSSLFSQWLLQHQQVIPDIIHTTRENSFKFLQRDFFHSPIVTQKEFSFVDFVTANWQQNWTLHCKSEDKLSTLYISTIYSQLFVGEDKEASSDWYISKLEMIIPYNFEKLLLLNHFHSSIQYQSISMLNKDLSLNIPFYCTTAKWKINHREHCFNVCTTKRFSKANQNIPERIIFVAKPITEENSIFFAHLFCKISNEITRVTIFQMIPLQNTCETNNWLAWDVQRIHEEREAIIEKMNSMDSVCENGIMSETYRKNTS